MRLSVLVLVVAFNIISGEDSFEIKHCGYCPRNLFGSAILYNNRDSIYILGGEREGFPYSLRTLSRIIIRYNTTDETFDKVGEFPYGVSHGSTAIGPDGDYFYFGGIRQYDHLEGYAVEASSDIFRISQDTLQPKMMDQTLHIPRIGAASVTIGNSLFMFGGDYCGEYTCAESSIEEYDLVTRNARIIGSYSNYEGMNSAIYDGRYAYIFGGYHVGGYYNESKHIHRFDPQTFVMDHLGEVLPRGVVHSAAIIIDNLAYIIPGGSIQFREFYSYDTLTQNVSTVDLVNFMGGTPTRAGALYAKASNEIYLFGVKDSGDADYNRLLCIDLTPNLFECTGKPDGLYPHPKKCNKYFQCTNEQKEEKTCYMGLHFSREKLACDIPELANCQIQ